MKKIIIPMIILMLMLIIITFSCISGKKAMITAKIVSENALAYVYVGNMERFLENIDAFLEPMGGIPMFGKIPIKSFIKMTVEAQAGISLDHIDFKKPWCGAVLPAPAPGGEIGFVICIPLNEPDKNFENIKQHVVKMLPWDIRLLDEYMILYSSKQPDTDFLPENTLDLSTINNYESGSLSIYVNIHNIYTAFGMTPQIIKSLIASNSDLSKGFIDPHQKEMTLTFFRGIIDAVTQINEIIINTNLNGKGILYRTVLGLQTGGSLEKLSDKLTLNTGIKDYAKYIPSTYLFSLAYNLNKRFLSELTDNIYNVILNASEIIEEDKIALISSLQNIIKVSGSKMATGMDIDFNLTGLTKELGDLSKSGSSNIEEVSRMLNSLYENMKINLVAVSDIKDTEGFRTSIKQMIEHPTIRALLDSIFKEIGINFSMFYTKDQNEGDFSYDELSYKLNISKLPETSDSETLKTKQLMQETIKALEVFINKYKVYIAFRKSKYYMVSGDAGIPLLKDLVTKDEFPGDNITGTSIYQSYGNLIPLDVHLFGHFSISRIVSMLGDIKEIGNMFDGMPLEPGILWYMRYSKGKWETTAMWDINEIAFLFGKISGMLPGLLEQGL